MITPAPTAKIHSSLARGTLAEMVPATATKPAYITIAFPNTNYQTHLLPSGPITAEIGKRILGKIHAKARRIDEVETGGRYIEPVYGRPRRVQGSVVGIDAENNTVIVDATMPIHCTPTDSRQKATDFQPGQFVSFDVMDGATFTQAS